MTVARARRAEYEPITGRTNARIEVARETLCDRGRCSSILVQ